MSWIVSVGESARCSVPGQHGSRGPVLVGMRGSGKTTIAPLLASALRMQWVDADAELERRQGRSVGQIFASESERGFRRLEYHLTLELLQRSGHVLATGGGAVLNPELRRHLSQRFTVWLDATPSVLAERICGTDRPSLSGQPIDVELSTVYAARQAFYREVASLRLDTSQLQPSAAVSLIADRFLQQKQGSQDVV